MLLAIAVENTRTLVGVLDRDAVVQHWLVSTDSRRTADEWTVLLRGLVGSLEVDGLAVCSAVPQVLHELRDVGARYYADVPRMIVEPGIRTGLRLLVDNPRELGADRIVNAIAAASLYGSPCVVVDFGTATTYDVIDEVAVVATGALAPVVISEARSVTQHEPLLTLLGLRIAFERNR